MQSEKSLRYPNLRKGLLSKYKHYSLISKLIQNIFYTLHITPHNNRRMVSVAFNPFGMNFNIFRMSNKKNKKVLIMAQIQNFGFIAHVQKSYVPDAPHKGSRHRQHERLAKGDEPAFCHTRHSEAYRARFGRNIPVGHCRSQCPYGALCDVQVHASCRTQTAENIML